MTFFTSPSVLNGDDIRQQPLAPLSATGARGAPQQNESQVPHSEAWRPVVKPAAIVFARSARGNTSRRSFLVNADSREFTAAIEGAPACTIVRLVALPGARGSSAKTLVEVEHDGSVFEDTAGLGRVLLTRGHQSSEVPLYLGAAPGRSKPLLPSLLEDFGDLPRGGVAQKQLLMRHSGPYPEEVDFGVVPEGIWSVSDVSRFAQGDERVALVTVRVEVPLDASESKYVGWLWCRFDGGGSTDGQIGLTVQVV